MPVHTAVDAIVTVTIDGQDLSCQLIGAELTPDDTGDGTIVQVACGDKYSEPGDPSPGRLSGDIFEDFRAAGFTRMLWENRDAQAAFTLVKNPGTPDEASFTGQLIVKAPVVAVTPGKVARNRIELPVVTVALAAAA